jgi:hypothetical protein
MTSSDVTHVGFSDESSWNAGRFGSLGLVTTPVTCLKHLEDELRRLVSDSDQREFKWSKLSGAKERVVAEKICGFVVDKACQGQIRLDVLVLDKTDSRHAVPGRDDIQNLQRMYYHLFVNVLRHRCPDNAVWRLHPDEQTALDWETVEDYVEMASERPMTDPPLFSEGGFRKRLRKEFHLIEIRPVSSDQHPLLQLADLFAGMAVFSREKFADYQAWVRNNSRQGRLFGHEPSDFSHSRSSIERFKLLRYFDELCKSCRLGVSLKTWKGLRTRDPNSPLNFWWYEPQHPADKAPTKKQG